MRSVLFFGAGVVLSLSFGTAFAQEPITTPLLSSDENFRDIAGTSTLYGGTGLANTTSYNGVMRTGVFYRSQDLSGLSDADSTVITSLKVQLDMDLRTPQEYTSTTGTVSQFDKVPKGATWTNVNIYGTYAPAPVDNVTTMEQAYQYMRGINEAFVDDSLQRKQIYTALMELANSSGPVLYHCSAGKDRTGWVSMLLEHIAGVSDATIMQDYLASNLYMNEYIRLQLTYLQQHNQVYMAPILVVDQSYLQAGLNQIIASYGSIDAYLIQGLGLTQADIYVLRAKMVYYPTLPGQDGFAGNAAAGAGLLSSLQNSPLSGNYTAFNYYLQSAIEAGTLGGVESQVGGQIHADAVSYLLREPLWLDWAIAPYTIGSDLGVGQSRCWAAGLGDCLRVGPRAGVAGSCDQNAGTVVGATRRLAEPAVAFVGVGYDGGSVESAGARADVDTVQTTLGGRYGFSGLEAGPYVAGRADLGWAEYRCTRAFGEGLGIAQGHTYGAFYSGRVDLGDVLHVASLTITPQLGARISNASLHGFNETGGELALSVDRVDHTFPSLLAGLDIALDPRQWGGWSVQPSVDLRYELALASPQVESTGGLYGYTVSQYSAYESWSLMRVGLAVSAQRGSLTVSAGADGLFGSEASTGIIPQLSIGYDF